MSVALMDLTPSDWVYQGFRAQIDGIDVVVLRRRGEEVPCAVTKMSILRGLGDDCPDGVRNFLNSRYKQESVLFEGRVSFVPVISFEAFFTFCMLNPSPKLDVFRDKLAKIAVQVQTRGSFISDDGGAARFLTPELTNDPTAQMLAALMDQRSIAARQQKALEQVQKKVEAIDSQVQALGDQVEKKVEAIDSQVQSLGDRVGRQIEDLRTELDQGEQFWTVRKWLSVHRVRLLDSDISGEGTRVGHICVRMGIEKPDLWDYRGSHAARRWPIKVLCVWWPECCRRRKIPLQWKIPPSWRDQ